MGERPNSHLPRRAPRGALRRGDLIQLSRAKKPRTQLKTYNEIEIEKKNLLNMMIPQQN